MHLDPVVDALTACFRGSDAGDGYRGQSQPNVPAVRSPYKSPSNTDLSVVAQLRLYQIEFCSSAREYPTNAVAPANRNTSR